MKFGDLSNICLGSTGLTRVYLGADLVWPKDKRPASYGSATLVTSTTQINTSSLYTLIATGFTASYSSGTSEILSMYTKFGIPKGSTSNEYVIHEAGRINLNGNKVTSLPGDALVFKLESSGSSSYRMKLSGGTIYDGQYIYLRNPDPYEAGITTLYPTTSSSSALTWTPTKNPYPRASYNAYTLQSSFEFIYGDRYKSCLYFGGWTIYSPTVELTFDNAVDRIMLLYKIN